METAAPIAILKADQIDQKLKRMAYEKEIIFAGICEPGEKIAKMLTRHLSSISDIKTSIVRIDLDKSHPFREEIDTPELSTLGQNKIVILVDDVLNTGKTIAYGLKPFLKIKLKKIEVAVLVNRSHTEFPIHPTYTGYELSTILSDHVRVELTGKNKGVYLE